MAIHPGARLPNGAFVIASRHVRDERGARIVLAFNHLNTAVPEYVTWRLDNQLNAYWGHYFDTNFAAAAQDFLNRT